MERGDASLGESAWMRLTLYVTRLTASTLTTSASQCLNKSSPTVRLLEKNRQAALDGIRHKYEKSRMTHSAQKFAIAWRHCVDEMHWAQVEDDGSRTPSKKERHDERRVNNQSPYYSVLRVIR